ncbi:hypothetical protein Cgig2_009071 [Carnegiea gigantea]|uniref:Uncharacterized protein n=1 Tax=Carnegiea gigantea TaxID=171969 RepID=A0A9Q1GWH6_9CARY|nr:hypothetical protein Cgig2_009071 [Carnegiea gigantea]
MLTYLDLKVKMQGSTSSRRGDHEQETIMCPRHNIQGMRKVSHSSQNPGSKSSSSSNEKLSDSSDPSDCHSLKSPSSLSSRSLSSSSACPKFSSTSLANTSTSPICDWHNECTSKSCKPAKSTLTIPKSKFSPGSKVPTVTTFLFKGLGVACNLVTGFLGL